MKFKKGQIVYNAHNGKDLLYEVLGYNAGGGIILLPLGFENEYKNKEVYHSDYWFFEKKGLPQDPKFTT